MQSKSPRTAPQHCLVPVVKREGRGCEVHTVVFRSIRKAIWGVTMLTNRTFRTTPWDMRDLRKNSFLPPFFDPNLGKFRVTSRGPFAQKPCDAVTYENFRRFLGV
jgi:hypothetical protein